MEENPVNAADFGCLVICAERYACGSSNGIPESVCNVIAQNIPKLTDGTLICLEDDIAGCNSLGNSDDAKKWHNVLGKVKEELERRNIRELSSANHKCT